MASQSPVKLSFSNSSIYLLNNTIHTEFERNVRLIPSTVPIFVNQALATRYQTVLQTRNYFVLAVENPFTFRALLRVIRNQTPAFVYLDVDQAAFQAIGHIALAKQVSVTPVFMSGNKAYMTSSVHLESQNAVLEIIQSYLFESYMGRATEEPVHLFNELLDSAKYYGDQTIICKDMSAQISYRNLLRNIYVLSQRLNKTLRHSGKSIGVLLPNSIGNVVTLFSLFYIGKTPVMLNYSAGLQTITDACETAEVGLVLTSREFIEKGQLEAIDSGLQERVQVVYLEDLRSAISLFDKLTGMIQFVTRRRASGEENSLVLFTSGSEYKPRGVVLSHNNIFANVQQTRSVIDFGIQDKMLNAMPMFHSFGLTAGALLPLLSGLQTYLYPSPLHYKRIPELAGEEGSTILFGTSSFLEKYGKFADVEDFRKLRYAVVGAERLKVEVEQFWLKKFGLQIMQGYGATETSPIMCLDTPLNHKQDSVGRFLPDIKHRLDAVPGIEEGGRLFIQGPNLMRGYLVHGQGYVPNESWYDTGDVVSVDEAGYVTIVGRLKRFAKIAGEMISLNLVEQLASQCYKSTDFAAVNVPDAKRGEQIILVTSIPELSLSPLQSTIASLGYSRLHVPSSLLYLVEFPLLGSGKTDYVTLKESVLAQVDDRK